MLSGLRIVAMSVIGLAKYGDGEHRPLASAKLLDGIDQSDINYLMSFEGKLFREKINELFSKNKDDQDDPISTDQIS